MISLPSIGSVYRFLGGFYAGHLLIAASGMVIVAGALILTSKDTQFTGERGS